MGNFKPYGKTVRSIGYSGRIRNHPKGDGEYYLAIQNPMDCDDSDKGKVVHIELNDGRELTGIYLYRISDTITIQSLESEETAEVPIHLITEFLIEEESK